MCPGSTRSRQAPSASPPASRAALSRCWAARRVPSYSRTSPRSRSPTATTRVRTACCGSASPCACSISMATTTRRAAQWSSSSCLVRTRSSSRADGSRARCHASRSRAWPTSPMQSSCRPSPFTSPAQWCKRCTCARMTPTWAGMDARPLAPCKAAGASSVTYSTLSKGRRCGSSSHSRECSCRRM